METLVPLELQGGYLIWLSYRKDCESHHSFHAVPSKGWRPGILPSWKRTDQGFAKIALILKKTYTKGFIPL